MVLRFLVNVPQDVSVQQFDGKVERIVDAVLNSLRDERSHNHEERPR